MFGEPSLLDADTLQDLITSDLLQGPDPLGELEFDLDELPPLQSSSGVSSEVARTPPPPPPPSPAKFT